MISEAAEDPKIIGKILSTRDVNMIYTESIALVRDFIAINSSEIFQTTFAYSLFFCQSIPRAPHISIPVPESSAYDLHRFLL